MSIDTKVIERTAQLANLELNDKDKEEFTTQLSDILDYVEKINELDTSSIQATDHIADLNNVFREDKVKSSIDKSEIIKNAPQFKNDHFVVPKIIDTSN